MEVCLLRASGVVPEPDYLPETSQDRGIVVQTGGRDAPFAVVARLPVLIPLDADCIRCLLNLPGLDVHATAGISQE